MTTTAADILIDALEDWGVDVVFGLPGDGINGIIEALRKRQDRVRFIQVRHEETAALMACGYAKFTGRLGVCLATSGPGAIHLLNGLYDAKMDGQPVLAITGMPYHDLISTYTQQDVETDKLFMDVAEYNARIMGPAHIENVADLACRTALSRRRVAHIAFPVDLQDAEIERRSARNVAGHTSEAAAHRNNVPVRSDLERAVDVLNAGSRIAILAGQGAIGGATQLEEVAEVLGAPVVKALLGKSALPDDSPYCMGGIGLLGTRPSQEVLEHCDTLLMVGTSFPYIEFLPKPGQARAVQIDIDPARIGLRYPVEVGLPGDAIATLSALVPLLSRHEDRTFLEEAQAAKQAWWDLMVERGSRTDKPMKPQVVALELGKQLAQDAIVVSDSGTITTWWARQIPAKRSQRFSVSGNLATMACGLPYAMAAQIAYPDRQCVAFVGDGGLSMLMAELATCAKYQLPVKVVVIKNDTLGQIKWEQMVFLGNPEYGVDLQPIDFAKVAEACHIAGFSVDDPAQCAEAIRRLLTSEGAALLEAVVDPLEPPYPAKTTTEQARSLLESLVKGQPNREHIALTVLSDKIRELI